MTDVPTWEKIFPLVLPSMVEAKNFQTTEVLTYDQK